MTTSAGVERRVGQRFSYLLPVSLRLPATCLEGVGFTQDLSSRGVFFFTDAPLTEGSEIELTLKMPSEITLGESMPVRCRGRILRVVRPSAAGNPASPEETKIGVAVRFDGYEYLPESDAGLGSSRVAALHPHHEEERPVEQSSARTILG